MKTILGIIIVLVLALGVWLSLRLGATAPADTSAAPATATSSAPAGWATHASPQGFSIHYPAGYSVDEAYKYQALGPGKDIAGVKFTIDPAVASGTNLSVDSYVSVEHIAGAPACTAELFLDGAKAQDITEGGMQYSFASTTGAGAGNRYEEAVYALPGTEPCIAVRYFLHYGALENYPAGAVEAFDRGALVRQFDQVRRTLTLAQ